MGDNKSKSCPKEVLERKQHRTIEEIKLQSMLKGIHKKLALAGEPLVVEAARVDVTLAPALAAAGPKVKYWLVQRRATCCPARWSPWMSATASAGTPPG